MPLSVYHQKYAQQNDKEIQHKADAKEQELRTIFDQITWQPISNPVKIAVLGCGDKRFITYHQEIFEQVIKKSVQVTTFDITLEHLTGESNIIQHDCTLPLLHAPYDITYAHVLLKFIEPKKQFDVIINSYEALQSGGIAIHIFDWEETTATGTKLSPTLWTVSLEHFEQKLDALGITYKKIPLTYGLALVLMRI